LKIKKNRKFEKNYIFERATKVPTRRDTKNILKLKESTGTVLSYNKIK